MICYLYEFDYDMTHEEQLEWEQLIVDGYARGLMPCPKTERALFGGKMSATAINHLLAFDRKVRNILGAGVRALSCTVRVAVAVKSTPAGYPFTFHP